METNETTQIFIRRLRKLIRESIAKDGILEDQLKEPVKVKKNKKVKERGNYQQESNKT